MKDFYYYHLSEQGIIMLFLHNEEGQGLLEYALVLVLVAIAIVAILTLLGPQIGNLYSRLITAIPG